MSTTIENKIVEMSFNNSDFEENARQSIETTEKLKKSLDFDGVGKGLEQIGTAAKNCDISVIGTAAEAVGEKFDAMKLIATYALYDIYNMATQTASQLVNLFAIEPVSSGFEEYELKMGAVQTIMASTNEDLSTVNAYLDELNVYADKTIYSFSDMTNNIGKFTNAGVSLDKAVAAIQGISNEAAVSGANTNEASRAMYNFAQALSAGYVKLIDWKSIENANMATVEFKQELINTAVELGNLEEQADGTYKVLTQSSTGSTMDDAISATQNFNDSLQYQWMTTDVLVETLNDYADETTAIGKKAFAAATEVKTFSMMMDTLTESAGSGWTETWEVLVGDFNEAKTFWTDLTNYFDTIIGNMSTARNNLLQDSLASGFDLIEKKVENAGINVDDFENKIKELGNASGVAVDDIINQAGSLGQAFADGTLSTDLITQAINELGASNNLTEKTIKSLNDSATNMFDNLEAKSGRTLLQESLFNVLNSIKTVIESISTAWNRVEEGFTASKIYGVIQKINTATSNFKAYIDENLADPWLDVESAITDSGLSMDEFQSRLIEAGNQNGVDVQALIDQYGSLEECFANNAISTDLVTQAYENLATETTTTTQTVTKTIDDLSETLDYYQNVVDEVWNGDWKNAPERYQLLAEAGYDYQKVQALVNRTVDQHRLTLEDLNEVGIDTTETTEEEVEALNELAESARESGKSVNEALNKMGHKTGLQIAVEAVHDVFVSLKSVATAAAESFKSSFFDIDLFNKLADDAYSAISYIQSLTSEMSDYVTSRFETIKSAFSGVFDSIKTIAVAFYNSIKAVISDTSMYDGVKSAASDALSWINKQLTKLTSYITSHGSQIERTLTGVFKLAKSIGKDIASVINGVVKVLAKLFGDVTDAAPDVLDMTANIGDFFSALADGVDISKEITDFFNNLITMLPNVKQVIDNVWSALRDMPVIGQIITDGENIWDGISGDVSGEIEKIKSGETNIKDVILGVGDTIVNAMASAAQTVKDKGIQGIIDVFKGGQTTLSDAVGGLADSVDGPSNEAVSAIQGFLGKLGDAALAIAPIVGSFAVLNGVADVIKQFSKAIETLAGPLAGVEKVFKSTSTLIDTANAQLKNLGNAVGFAIKTEAFVNLAIAVGIIAGVVVVLAEIAKYNPEGIQTALYIMSGILIAMAGVLYAATTFTKGQVKKMQIVSQAALGIAAVIAILALVMIALGTLDPAGFQQGMLGLIVIMALLMVMMAIMANTSTTADIKISVGFQSMAKIVLAVAAAVLIIAGAIAIINMCDQQAISAAETILFALMAFVVVVLLLSVVLSKNAATLMGSISLMKTVGSVMESIGKAFVLVAAGVFLIGQLTPEQLSRAESTLLELGVFIGALIIVAGIAARISQGQVLTISSSILAMVVAIGLMAALAIALSYVDILQFSKGVLMLSEVTAVCLGMYAVMAVISSKCGVDKLTSMGLTLVAMTVCIGLMAAIAVLLGYCDVAKLTQGVVFVGVLAIFASAMALAAGQIKEDKISTIAALAAAVAILAVIAVAFTLLDPASLGIAVGALSTLMICFGLLMKCLSTLNGVKINLSVILTLVIVMASIAAVIAIMCTLVPNVDQAASVGVGIAAIMLSLAAMIKVLSSMATRMTLASKQMSQMAPVILVAVGIMAACAILIGVCCAISGGQANQAVVVAAAIGILMLTLAASLEAFSKINANLKTSTVVALGILVAAIAVIAIVIGMLVSNIGDRGTEAIACALALSAVLAALVVCVIALGKFSGTTGIKPSCIVALALLVTLMPVIGNVISAMTNAIDPSRISSAYASAIALSMVLAALTLCVIALSRFGGSAPISVGTIAIIATFSVCLGAIGECLSTLINAVAGNADAAIPAARSLAIVLAVLSLCVIALSQFSGNNLSLAVVATFAVFTAALVEIGNTLATLINAVGNNAEAAEPAAKALAVVITALAAVAVLLSNASGSFITGIAGVGTLSALVLAIIGVIAVIGELNQLTNGGLGTAVQSAMDIINTIATGIGTAIGNFIGSIGTALADQLVHIISKVVSAMLMLATGCAVIDDSAFSKVETFAQALSSLAGAEISTIVANILGGGNIDIAGALTKLGEGVAAFANSTSGVDLSNVEQGANAAKTLMDCLSEMPTEGGILSSIFGTANYDKFADGVTKIGAALPAFVESVGDIDTDSVQPSCEALQTLMSCFDNIPDTGGLLQQIMGGTDYSKFAQGMEDIGAALPKFVEAVGDVNTDSVQPSADAIGYLLEKLKNMPYEGGLLDCINGGTMNVEQLQELLPAIGTAIKQYCENTADIDTSKAYQVTVTFGNILNSLKQIQEANIDKSIATKFKETIDELKKVDIKGLSNTYNSETGSTASSALSGIYDQIKQAIEGLDFTSLGTTLSSKLSEGISTAMSGASATTDTSFVSAIAQSLYNADSVQQFTTVGVNLANMFKSGLQQGFTSSDGSSISITSIMGSLTTSINEQQQAMTTAGTNLANWFKTGFSQAFSSLDSLNTSLNSMISTLNGYYQNFYTAGVNMAGAFRDGFKSSIGTVEIPIDTVVSQVDSASTDFSTSGASAMSNYADGMSANTGLAATQASYASSNAASAASSGSGSFYAPGASAMISYASGMTSGGNYATAAMTVINAAVIISTLSASSAYMAAGTTLANSFASGLRAGSGMASAAATVVAAAACAAISIGNAVFYAAGYNAALGFANGISSGSFAAVIAARAMANAASNAAQKALDEHSPSKVFFGIGDYAAQGLALGMEDRTNMVERAGANIATSAIAGYNSVAGGSLFDMNTSIIPSIDYASISSNTGKLDFSATMNRLIADPVKTSADRMAETQARFEASNQKIVDGLSAVQNDLSAYTTAVANSETAMYLDGKKVASSLAKPMNKAMGTLARQSKL